ncbi:RNA polymerase sigma factor [Flavisolibacter nicotianae]|uniref:RNA polymerase sigma factor n=1 Tax=Flavisolibacter nicotianae TaxID=2364882 RepID=UPI000EB3D796|nr:RNA polymerase sigma factor [Flavisolibacter nicotianae]
MSIQEFSSLVLHNADGLKPFAITLTRDQEAARDLCQETLCKAFTYREKYEPGTNIKAWLFTIMRNIFINDYRRNQRKKGVMDTVKGSVTPYALSPENTVRLKEIHAALHQLPAIFKTACLLYLQGYKYHEIALALNEPLGTIKSRIHFAKKMLQKQIDR